MRSIDDEVRGVRDRQHEARRIGDEGADEQIREWPRPRALGSGVHGRSQYDGGCIVREEDRDDDSHPIHQREKPGRRALRLRDGVSREPVEEPLLTGDFGQQHHADQKQVDIGALEHGGDGVGQRNEGENHDRRRAENRPQRLGQPSRPDDDPQHGESRNGPGGKMGKRSCRHQAAGGLDDGTLCISNTSEGGRMAV